MSIILRFKTSKKKTKVKYFAPRFVPPLFRA
jgi:hypothetical protein